METWKEGNRKQETGNVENQSNKSLRTSLRVYTNVYTPLKNYRLVPSDFNGVSPESLISAIFVCFHCHCKTTILLN